MGKKCPKCGREFGNSSVRCPICKCALPDNGLDRSVGVKPERVQKLRQPDPIQGTQSVREQNYQQQHVAQQRVNVPRPMQKQGPSGLSITALVFSLLGCLSIVGLVLGIVDLCVNKHGKKVCSVLALIFSGLWIIGMAAFVSGNDRTNRPSVANNSSNYTPGQSSKNAESNLSNQYSVGNTVVGEDWKITLQSAKMYDEIEGDFYNDSPADGKRYLVLFFEVENVSNEDDYFNYYYIESYLDGYNTNFVITMNEPEGYGDLTGDVAAGKKLKGCLKYEVSSDWEELEVSYKEWIGTSDKIATFVVTPDKVR